MFRCLLHSVLDLLKASGGGSTRISRLCTHLRTMEGAAAMLGGGTTATRNRGGDDGGARRNFFEKNIIIKLQLYD